jgi:hypothetical protein
MAVKKKFKTAAPVPEDWEISIPKPDEDEYFVDWCDATLQADHWFSMPAVGPNEAAMVLSGFSPNEEDFQSAIRSQPPVMWSSQPRKLQEGALRVLEQQFQSQDKARPGCRTLFEWFEVAEAQKLKVHPWVQRYVELRALTHSRQKPGELKPVPHKKGALWTDEELAALLAERKTHTERELAQRYGMHGSRIRALVERAKAMSLSRDKDKSPTGYAAKTSWCPPVARE